MDPIDAVRDAARRADTAQRRADVARQRRDEAIVDALRKGARVPLLADVARLSLSAIRKIADSATDNEETP